MWKSIVAIAVGGSLGSLLRWWLGTVLNAYFPTVPPGTLTANLAGGYIIGLAIAFFATCGAVAPEFATPRSLALGKRCLTHPSSPAPMK